MMILKRRKYLKQQKAAPHMLQSLPLGDKVRISQSLFNISACADWRDRFFVLQGKKPQKS